MQSQFAWLGCLAALLGLFVAGPAPAVPISPASSPGPTTTDRLRQDARRLESLGQWAGALELYLRLPAAARHRPAVRQRVQTCLRRLLQSARQHDPAYRSQVLGLSLYQALREYREVLGKLQANYVDRDRVATSRLIQAGAEELDAALADPWFRHEFLPAAGPKAIETFRTRLHHLGLDETADLREAARLVEQLALDAQHELGLGPTVAVMEFACGACNALDEYSAYLPPGHGDELATPGGELAALGLRFGFTAGLVVERVTPAGPASLAGLRDGDRVLRLGGKSLDGLARSAVAEMLHNETGLMLEMEVAGPGGGAARSVRLPLDLPAVPPTGVKMLVDGVGYVRLTGFTRLAAQDLDEAVLALRMQGLRALVLDLRGNPGGLFHVAVQIAERFLADGPIVETRGRVPGSTQTYQSSGGMSAWDFPVVLLVDGETASAAEVLAGALKDRGRAELVGQPTYGKGTIQGVLPLKSLGALRLTLARFFPPSGRAFAGVGIAPHILEANPERQLELAVARARALATMRP